MHNKLAIVCGSFEVLHNGHAQMITHAASLAERLLLIVGSPNSYRGIDMPAQRAIIESWLVITGSRNPVIHDTVICEVPDILSDRIWVSSVWRYAGQVSRSNGISARASNTVWIGKRQPWWFYLPKNIYALEYDYPSHTREILEHIVANGNIEELQGLMPDDTRHLVNQYIQKHGVERFRTVLERLGNES